jgi:hypothetical protein
MLDQIIQIRYFRLLYLQRKQYETKKKYTEVSPSLVILDVKLFNDMFIYICTYHLAITASR